MITYMTALYQEARPIIELLGLKQDTQEHFFQLYVGSVRLIVTGAGAVSGAAAIARYYTLYPPAPEDILINFGIAGCLEVWTEKSKTCPQIGDLFLVSCITELATGRTFYPDILFQHSFPLLPLLSSPVPVTDAKTLSWKASIPSFINETEEEKLKNQQNQETLVDILVDMEAAAIYQAALPYLSTERMFFFKVISDRIGTEQLTALPQKPEQLLHPHCPTIHAFALQTEQILQREQKEVSFFTQKETGLIQELLEKLPLTESMAREWNRLVLYSNLAGICLEPILEDFLSSLPNNIRGKKQAAPYLEELRNRILKVPGSLTVTKTSKEGYLPTFSMVYAEKSIFTELLQQESLPFSKEMIPIHHYKDVFNRSHQNFARQKKSPALIFAKKPGTLIYPGAPVCQSFGNTHFYYTSCMMNCIYHCEYCYLQGMYPSGHVVVFVNLEDYFKEIEALLLQHPVYLCISYDTDLLALENLFGFVKKWLSFAKNHPTLTLEIRTKSGNPAIFSELAALYKDHSLQKNCIFAWTVSPKQICESVESGAVSLSVRLKALLAAANSGFPVRLCFDPMLYHGGWKENYQKLITQIFHEISPDILYDVSIGVFRISTEYLKNMRKKRPDSAIVQYPYQTEHGVSHYGTLSEEMVFYLKDLLLQFLPEEKIFLWNGGD